MRKRCWALLSTRLINPNKCIIRIAPTKRSHPRQIARETMMRRSQTSGVAGNCSCCLVPALILLAIIVAAVIGVAVVWQSAMPSVFRWDYAYRHHYNAYRDGYEQGNKLGADYARRGDPEPTGQDLGALARREADRLHVRRDRGQWIEGFRNGFTRGFEEFNNQASNQRPSWSRLGVGDSLGFAP